MIFLTHEEIVRLNRRHIEKAKNFYVEPDNLRNPDSLEWVLEAIQYPLFGVDNYPTLAEKAALLAQTIIGNHVFYDGNKRTGMSALDIFIRLNGYQLNVSNEEIVEVALWIAGKKTHQEYSFDKLVQWVRDNLAPKGANSDLFLFYVQKHYFFYKCLEFLFPTLDKQLPARH